MTGRATALVAQIRLPLANAYLVKGERPVLVDTGAPGDARAVLRALARERVDPREISLILLTHAHSDHAGSCAALRAATGAPVALGRGDVARAASGRNGPLPPTRFSARVIRLFVDRPFAPFSPDIVLEDGVRLDDYGLAARVIATPGHTSGSMSLKLDDGDAIVGDILMGGMMGGAFLPQRPAVHYFVEDRAENRASLQRVLSLGPKRLHVGHGGPLETASVSRHFGLG